MKIKKSELRNIIRETIEEQLGAPGVTSEIEDVEELFGYIREKLQDKDFTMAMRFIENLKKTVEEMEHKAYALRAYEKDEL